MSPAVSDDLLFSWQKWSNLVHLVLRRAPCPRNMAVGKRLPASCLKEHKIKGDFSPERPLAHRSFAFWRGGRSFPDGSKQTCPFVLRRLAEQMPRQQFYLFSLRRYTDKYAAHLTKRRVFSRNCERLVERTSSLLRWRDAALELFKPVQHDVVLRRGRRLLLARLSIRNRWPSGETS
jgi:hypothetical protein